MLLESETRVKDFLGRQHHFIPLWSECCGVVWIQVPSGLEFARYLEGVRRALLKTARFEQLVQHTEAESISFAW